MKSIIMRWDNKKVDAHIIDGRVEPNIHVYNPETDETDSFVEYQGNQYSLVFENTDEELVHKAYDLMTSFSVVE